MAELPYRLQMRLRYEQARNRSLIPGKGIMFMPYSEPGALPTSSVGTGVSFLGIKRPCVRLMTHLHFVSKLSMNKAIPPLPHMPSWCAQGQFYLTLSICCSTVH